MTQASTDPEPRILTYESPRGSQGWVLVASRVVHVAGFIAWLVVGVSFYNLYTALGDGPGPFWFDATAGVVAGGIVASPLFALAFLVQPFGRRIAARCGGPARWAYSLCVRKGSERRSGH